MNFEMPGQSSNDDCYFYYYSSCTKGDECPFRHCKLALGTETVCSLWKEGRCFRSNCKFRHMESRINRGTIPCYWENQPGGCRKPHCVFMHRKLKNVVQSVKASSGLILPTSDGKVSPKLPDISEPKKSVSVNPQTPESFQDVAEDFTSEPSSVPVTPLVLSFDEAEESDAESVSSTPVKMPSDVKLDSTGLAKSNLSSRLCGEASGDKDFGIKTLEQIRMEKIHKESDNYYYTDNTPGKGFSNVSLDANQNPSLLSEPVLCYSGYDVPSLEVTRHMEPRAKEYYPPQSDFISLPAGTPMDKNSPVAVKDAKQHAIDKESDLRNRLCKRLSPSNKMNPVKKVISFKKQDKTEENSDPLNFKIKTLDEIRKEKESKQGTVSDVEDRIHSGDHLRITTPVSEDKTTNNITMKPVKKPKITRRPKEVYVNSALNTINPSDPVLARYSVLSMVSNGITQVTEEQESNHIPCTQNSINTSPVKRKSEEVKLEKDNKFIKLDSTSSHEVGNSKEATFMNGKLASKETEKPAAISLRPFIRRTKLSQPRIQSVSDELSQPRIQSASDETSGEVLSSSPIPDLPTAVEEVGSRLSPNKSDDPMESNDASLTADNGCSVSSSTDKRELDIEEKTSGEEDEALVVRSHSVDEFEHYLNEAGMDVEEMDENPGENDDILLEVEQFLDS